LAGSGLEVVVQGAWALGPWQGEGGWSHATRPNILIRRGGETVCVIDTKWKCLSDGIAQADVYQMIAYARLYRCPRLILLYPATQSDIGGRVGSRTLSPGPERLDLANVRIEAGELEIRTSLRRLVSGDAVFGNPAAHLAPSAGEHL
jgi:5-methylcytosine-specific restriction enzyme subunit McrC